MRAVYSQPTMSSAPNQVLRMLLTIVRLLNQEAAETTEGEDYRRGLLRAAAIVSERAK